MIQMQTGWAPESVLKYVANIQSVLGTSFLHAGEKQELSKNGDQSIRLSGEYFGHT